MGVRQSKLDEVLSLALGTSPVTLKEMVAAYGTIANGGNYLEPVLVTRIEDRKGQVLADFAPAVPEQALSKPTADLLVDILRGAVDKGTGTGIRTRFGIQADVAGKTGTTQNNTDGWFILMHPQLVAGAWVGFNDSRITMRDSWGQGAHSALPIVGDFFQQALRGKRLNGAAVFGAAREWDVPTEPLIDPDSPLAPLVDGLAGWLRRVFPVGVAPASKPGTCAQCAGGTPFKCAIRTRRRARGHTGTGEARTTSLPWRRIDIYQLTPRPAATTRLAGPYTRLHRVFEGVGNAAAKSGLGDRFSHRRRGGYCSGIGAARIRRSGQLFQE
jgi:membrane peptidoglycan carboxypeptidase